MRFVEACLIFLIFSNNLQRLLAIPLKDCIVNTFERYGQQTLKIVREYEKELTM